MPELSSAVPDRFPDYPRVSEMLYLRILTVNAAEMIDEAIADLMQYNGGYGTLEFELSGGKLLFKERARTRRDLDLKRPTKKRG